MSKLNSDLIERFEAFSNYSKPSLAYNAFFKWGAMAVNIATVFLLTPFVISQIGKYGYGIWALLTSMVGYYGLLNLGITSAVSRFVSLNLGKKDLPALSVTFNTAFFAFFITGLLAIFLAYTIGPILAGAFSVEDEAQFVALIKVMGIAVALGFPTSVLISLLIAHESYRAQSAIAIISSLLKTACTVYLLLNGHGLMGVAYAFLIAAVFNFVAYLVLVLSNFPWVQVSWSDARLDMLKKMVKFGIPTLIMTVGGLLRTKLDTIVIGSMLSIEQVAVYSIAALIITQVFSIANSGLGVVTPRFARLHGAGKDLRPLFFSGLFFGSVLAFSAGVGVFLFGEHFIQLWLGDGFAEAIPVLWILMFCYIITIIQIPGFTVLLALNKHSIFAAINICEGIANVILSVLLAPKFGLVGVAMGTAIPMLVVKTIVQPYLVSRAVGVSLKEYIKPTLIPALYGILFVGITFYLQLNQNINDLNWLYFVLIAIGVMGTLFALIISSAKLIKPELLKLNY